MLCDEHCLLNYTKLLLRPLNLWPSDQHLISLNYDQLGLPVSSSQYSSKSFQPISATMASRGIESKQRYSTGDKNPRIFCDSLTSNFLTMSNDLSNQIPFCLRMLTSITATLTFLHPRSALLLAASNVF